MQRHRSSFSIAKPSNKKAVLEATLATTEDKTSGRYAFKLTWMALGVTILAEVAGKTILSNGLASQLLPRKYYTIPRETLDALIGDVHELVNFFVIESQRVFFAENIWASIAVCVNLAFFPFAHVSAK